MSDFLENLKSSLDKGEFNSDAAKKINEIDKLADVVAPTAGTNFEKRLADAGVKTVSEEEAKKANTEYDIKMQALKEQELVIQQVATLKDIDEAVVLTIGDMFDFVKTLETSFDNTKSMHAPIFAEIERIKSKYSSIINN